jgi:NAD/NADP transhydrogenase alpha subunit
MIKWLSGFKFQIKNSDWRLLSTLRQSLCNNGLNKALHVFHGHVAAYNRAQAMDVLSSQANIAGYKAALEQQFIFEDFFPCL